MSTAYIGDGGPGIPSSRVRPDRVSKEIPPEEEAPDPNEKDMVELPNTGLPMDVGAVAETLRFIALKTGWERDAPVRKMICETRPSTCGVSSAVVSAAWIAVPPVACSPFTYSSAASTFSRVASTGPVRNGRASVANAITLKRSAGPRRPSA